MARIHGQCAERARHARKARANGRRLSTSTSASLNTVRVATDFTEMALDVEVWDLRQLNQLLAQLKELDCVATVRRLYE